MLTAFTYLVLFGLGFVCGCAWAGKGNGDDNDINTEASDNYKDWYKRATV